MDDGALIHLPDDPGMPLAVEDLPAWVEAAGGIVTGPGGPCELRPMERDLVAVVANGAVLIAFGRFGDPIVEAGLLRIAGRVIDGRPLVLRQPWRQVPMGLLRRLQPRRATASVRADGQARTQMESFLRHLLGRAASVGASDLHVEAGPDGTSIQMRVDGVLDLVRQEPGRGDFGGDLLQTMFSKASTSAVAFNPRQYQAASITVDDPKGADFLPQGIQTLRLQFSPRAAGGTVLVVRLLPESDGRTSGFAELGFAPAHLPVLNRLVHAPHGVILNSGPVCSGKSTTAKAMLEAEIAATTSPDGFRRGRNVLTLEDPPEYRIEGARQLAISVQDNAAAARAAVFAEAFNATLRSDPNTIYISEIRDGPSAQLAWWAAATGHRLLSTLHANSAFGIVPRLRDIGVELYKLTDPGQMRGLIGQRLMPRLCPHCSLPIAAIAHPGWTLRDRLPDGLVNLWRGNRGAERLARIGALLSGLPPERTGIRVQGCGCDACRGGIAGRVMIAEVFETDDELLRLLTGTDHAATVRYRRATLRLPCLADHAFARMLAGEVDPIAVEETLGLISGHLRLDPEVSVG